MKYHNLIVLFILFSWSCANMVQPTGGPKDTDPPKVVSMMPQQGQKNYTDQQLIIEFDEFITVKNLKEELLITPRVDVEYDYKIKKHTFYLTFAEPLKDSTTYTVNFRDGIVDITEGNPVVNLQVAFSTGNMLDTLEISGVVQDLFTKMPIDGATIGLYTLDDTLDIFTGPPYYFTKSNKQGVYTFKNIKDGAYKLYAYLDKNKNSTCQSSSEIYGFLPNIFKLDTAVIADTLEMYNLNLDTLELKRTRLSGRYFLATANKYLVNAKLATNTDSTLFYTFDDEHSGLKIYNSFQIKDSLKVFSMLMDSLGMVANDTFYLKFPETTRKADEFKISINEANASLNKKNITGKIKYDKPIKYILQDSILIYKDSLESYPVNLHYSIDSLNNQLLFDVEIPQPVLDTLSKKVDTKTASSVKRGSGKLAAKKPYKLLFKPASFITIENDSSTTMKADIKFNAAAKTGSLSGSITTSYKSFTIQLLDDKYNIIQEHVNGNQYSFDEIPPGEYIIRIIIDENENGKWDPGNIRLNQLPEKIIIYQDESGKSKTSIRANWELTIDLTF